MGLLLVGAQPENPKIALETSVNNEVTAGTDFLVTVRIDKGNLTEYSRYSQELPYGLTAVNVHSPNADFSFENQRVRVIWLKLPEENEVTVEYKIKVHERLKGSFALGAEFAYIKNNERNFVKIDPPVKLNIQPEPGLDPSLVVDISDFKKSVPDQTAIVVQDFAKAIRQEPELLSNGEVLVKIMVRNPEGSTYMKIEENLPKGYIFEEVDSEGGIVSYAANQVRFIWMKRPLSDPLMISYKLVPKAGEKQDPVNLTGSFSYSANGKSETVPFKEVAVNLTALTREQQLSLMQQGDIIRDGNTAQMQVTKKPEQMVKDQNETNRIISKQQPEGQSVAAGLEFRVQIGAFSKPVNKSIFSRKGVTMAVTEYREGNLYKYAVGPYKSYNEAKDCRERIVRNSSFRDAFVVAYFNGKRIPVREALKK